MHIKKTLAPKLNPNEMNVLEKLVEDYDSSGWGEGGFYSFAPLSKITGLTVPEVRRACRSLTRKGLAVFERSLWSDDGTPAGAGYGATEEGAKLLNPCDDCGELTTYDWQEDTSGKFSWQQGFEKETATRRRECEDCHEKKKLTPSPNA